MIDPVVIIGLAVLAGAVFGTLLYRLGVEEGENRIRREWADHERDKRARRRAAREGTEWGQAWVDAMERKPVKPEYDGGEVPR